MRAKLGARIQCRPSLTLSFVLVTQHAFLRNRSNGPWVPCLQGRLATGEERDHHVQLRMRVTADLRNISAIRYVDSQLTLFILDVKALNITCFLSCF